MFRKSHLMFPLAPKRSFLTIYHLCLWSLAQKGAWAWCAPLCLYCKHHPWCLSPADLPLHCRPFHHLCLCGNTCACVAMCQQPRGEWCWVAALDEQQPAQMKNNKAQRKACFSLPPCPSCGIQSHLMKSPSSDLQGWGSLYRGWNKVPDEAWSYSAWVYTGSVISYYLFPGALKHLLSYEVNNSEYCLFLRSVLLFLSLKLEAVVCHVIFPTQPDPTPQRLLFDVQ